MLKTLVLLCSVSTDPSACTRRTAIDFYPLPGTTVVCGLGDAMGAGDAAARQAGRELHRDAMRAGSRGGAVEL